MTRQIVAASLCVFTELPYRPIAGLSLGAQYAMAQRSRRQIYETAFDSKVEKKSEETPDLIDRIANHPILQLLHLRRRSRHSNNNNNNSNNNNGVFRTRSVGGATATVVPSTSSDPKFQVGVYTPKGRRGDRGRGRGVAVRPARSASTHHLTERPSRPVALSKSDDEILNRGSDSLEEEEEAYGEGRGAKELAEDLRTLHLTHCPIPPQPRHKHHYQEERKGGKKRRSKVGAEESEVSRSQALPRAPPRILELRSPPGTAPLPIKFSKRTPGAETSPSSWFAPPRQKDLTLPVKRSVSREGMGLGLARGAPPCHSRASLDVSMEVLLDPSSQRDLKAGPGGGGGSMESVVTGSTVSSLESLRSSTSDASKTSYRSSSDSSLTRPALNLSAPHRSIIQSAKFQILSPISDKSQEPSSDQGCCPSPAGPPEVASGNLAPPRSQHRTPTQPRDIREDFRNFHHVLPGPPRPDSVQGSDSGISIEYARISSRRPDPPYADLPFDMPKLRRRLAAAAVKTSLSSSTSSISSSGPSDPPRLQPSLLHPTLNPIVSRLQVCEAVSGTSSSNSSDWDTRSSADSSDDQGTPRLSRDIRIKSGLALDLGCAAMAVKGEKVDTKLPLAKQGWYHGAVSRTEAEATLRSYTEGSYLVRSLLHQSRHEYSLALKSARGFMHLRIQFDHKSGHYQLGRGTKLFPSVPHMVHHHSIFRLPIKGAEHMVLLHPVMHDTL